MSSEVDQYASNWPVEWVWKDAGSCFWKCHRKYNKVVLISSVDKVSKCESFQLVVLIVYVQVQPGAECVEIAHSMRVRIAQARVAPSVGCNRLFDPRSPGSDLSPVIRADLCALWSVLMLRGITSQVGIAHYHLHVFFFQYASNWPV